MMPGDAGELAAAGGESLALPQGRLEVRRWLRRATASDLRSWVGSDPDAVQSISPIAEWLNLRVLRLDPGGRVGLEAAFTAPSSALNPWGHVHGGAIAAASDEVACLVAALVAGPRNFAGTISAAIAYIRPVRDGEFRIVGSAVGRTMNTITVDVELIESTDRIADKATFILGLRRGF